jgi:hypothetical protein
VGTLIGHGARVRALRRKVLRLKHRPGWKLTGGDHPLSGYVTIPEPIRAQEGSGSFTQRGLGGANIPHEGFKPMRIKGRLEVLSLLSPVPGDVLFDGNGIQRQRHDGDDEGQVVTSIQMICQAHVTAEDLPKHRQGTQVGFVQMSRIDLKPMEQQ